MEMNSDRDSQFLLLLDALESGVTPSDRAAVELQEMGFIEPGPNGEWVMTITARVKLQNLRSIKRLASSVELFSGDVSDWST